MICFANEKQQALERLITTLQLIAYGHTDEGQVNPGRYESEDVTYRFQRVEIEAMKNDLNEIGYGVEETEA